MAVLEKSALMIMQDAAGNDVIVYPITTIGNVDGALTEEEIIAKIQGTVIPYGNLDGVPATFPPSTHTHNYAGSSSAGGAAISANKLNANAGSVTQPVYFSGGVPVKTTHTLGASVPSDAKFTDTTYSAASTTAAGLMSAADKSKLDGIASGANNYTYTLPTAGSTLGGVKTTSTVTSTSGLTACPIISGVPYYKDTNNTYTLSSFGVTATATELNYTDGVTSNIQTQLNGKAASGHTHDYLPLSGGSMTDSIAFGDAKGVGLKWDTRTNNGGIEQNPFMGYCSTSGDGTFVVSSLLGTTYDKGLAIGGSSGNLLWKGAKVIDANNISEYANKYTLPTASSSTLGGVKTTSTVTSTSGLTACPIISGVPYYKDTNNTYSLSSFGITATATELNYTDGVTSNIQTQLNTKAALASPTFTGTPKAPTATAGTNTTQLATTAFVTTAVANKTSVSGNAGTATKLAEARTISLTGDVTGSGSFDGSANLSITATIADDSHNHTISNIDGLQDALDEKLSTTGKAASATTADSATKATKDGSGNIITSTYATIAQLEAAVASLQAKLNNAIVNLTVSNNVVTFEKGDGTTDSITINSVYG